MCELKREFRGIWIPREILINKSLSANEKVYLSIYQELSQDGVPFPELKADDIMLKSVSARTIQTIKAKLNELGYLNVARDANIAKDLVLKSKEQGATCDWCGTKTIALQKHHYPIPKNKGGTQTVSICPNCHFEYHLIMRD